MRKVERNDPRNHTAITFYQGTWQVFSKNMPLCKPTADMKVALEIATKCGVPTNEYFDCENDRFLDFAALPTADAVSPVILR